MSTPRRPAREPVPRQTHHTERRGVSQFEDAIAALGWTFREKSTVDFGIDGDVETADDDGRPSGALVAVQIKGGPSEFDEESPNGWWFRFPTKHYRYWTAYCLPVYVVLVDIETREFYWQRVHADKIVSTGEGWKVEVPRSNDAAAAFDEWHREAGGWLDEAVEHARLVADKMPPATHAVLATLQASLPDIAAHLTAFLGGSAGAARLAVLSLLEGAPRWLLEAPGEAWQVVAAFASEHDCHDLAAEAFERAAELLPENAGKLLVAAASQYCDVDRGKARQALERAAEGEVDPLTFALVTAMVEHPEGLATPIPAPDLMAEQPDAVGASSLAQSFLGGNAIRAQDVTAAVHHFTAAVDLEPESSSLRLHLAEAHQRRALSGLAQPNDVTMALRHAEHAYQQRRTWGGPTSTPLIEILKTLLIRLDLEELVRRGTGNPSGTATSQESTDPEVLNLVTVAAIRLGRRDLALSSARAMPNGALQDWHLLALEESSALDEATAVDAILTKALEEEDDGLATRCVLRLSRLGVDRTSVTEALLERGIVPQSHVLLPRALLAHQHDPDSAETQLRALASDEPVAAELLVNRLVSTGRHDEALALLDSLPPNMRVSAHTLRVQALWDAGRGEAAERAAVDALTDGSLGSLERQELYRVLAGVAGERDRPDEVITWCNRALATQTPDQADARLVWWLIASQLNLQRADDAWSTYRNFLPEVAEQIQIRWWATLHALHGWTDDSLQDGLLLAERWADDPVVAGGLLTVLVSARIDMRRDEPESAEDEHEPADPLAQAIWAEVSRHCDEHGDASPIQRVEFDPQDPLAAFGHRLRARAELVDQVTNAVRGLQSPLGLLSDVIRRPYGLAVVQRAAGLQTACTPDPSEFDLEVTSALAMLETGSSVVTEASALHLLGVLDLASVLLPRLQRLLLPRASGHDIQRAVFDARQLQSSPGGVQWDTGLDRPVYIEVTPESQNDILRRTDTLAANATRCEVVIEGPLRLFQGEDDERGHSGAWLAPLQVAVDEGLSLWSDDLVLRRLARELGVSTFGTIALLHAVLEREPELMDAGTQEAITVGLINEWVVDTAGEVGYLLDLQVSGRTDLHATLAALARPWRYEEAEDRERVIRTVIESVDGDPIEHRRWFCAIALGLCLSSAEPASAAAVLAALVASRQPDPGRVLRRYTDWLTSLLDPEGIEIGEAAIGRALDVAANETGACREELRQAFVRADDEAV
jgi:tetratricopeptide (TPR) repeat protein